MIWPKGTGAGASLSCIPQWHHIGRHFGSGEQGGNLTGNCVCRGNQRRIGPADIVPRRNPAPGVPQQFANSGVAVTFLGGHAGESAPQNTETLGSTIDRLSILALRIYHLIEQRDRSDATSEHRESVARKLAIALAQQADLTRAAQQLADDLFSGRKRHKTYRQLKMYNDPALNPYLYKSAGA